MGALQILHSNLLGYKLFLPFFILQRSDKDTLFRQILLHLKGIGVEITAAKDFLLHLVDIAGEGDVT